MADIKVTEVRVKLAPANKERLLGYCSVTLNNAFVVKDLKIIQGEQEPFVAMPSRKIQDRCPQCGHKNHLRARFCNECGNSLSPDRAELDARGRAKLHFDLIHPISSKVREYMHEQIVEAYAKEAEAKNRKS